MISRFRFDGLGLVLLLALGGLVLMQTGCNKPSSGGQHQSNSQTVGAIATALDFLGDLFANSSDPRGRIVGYILKGSSVVLQFAAARTAQYELSDDQMGQLLARERSDREHAKLKEDQLLHARHIEALEKELEKMRHAPQSRNAEPETPVRGSDFGTTSLRNTTTASITFRIQWFRGSRRDEWESFTVHGGTTLTLNRDGRDEALVEFKPRTDTAPVQYKLGSGKFAFKYGAGVALELFRD